MAERAAREGRAAAKVTDALLRRAQTGDSLALEAVFERYKGIVRAKSRTYFLIGADSEDLIQEGMIGLYKAIKDYKPQRHASFASFAEMCIMRQIFNAIKAATRRKHLPLNSYVSLNKTVPDGTSDPTMQEVARAIAVSGPEDLVIDREQSTGLQQRLDELLSEFERAVLRLYLEGEAYGEMSAKLGRTEKSIDNALQRVKRKLQKHLFLPAP